MRILLLIFGLLLLIAIMLNNLLSLRSNSASFSPTKTAQGFLQNAHFAELLIKYLSGKTSEDEDISNIASRYDLLKHNYFGREI